MKQRFFVLLIIFLIRQICFSQHTLPGLSSTDTLYRDQQLLNSLDSITGYKNIWRTSDDSISYMKDSSNLKIYQQVCGCIEINGKMSDFDENQFSKCFEKTIKANKEFVLHECQKKYGDTFQVSKFTKDLKQLTLINLVYYCDDYYTLLSNGWDNVFTVNNEKDVKSSLEKINQKSQESRDENFYTNRGVMYFYLHNFDKALNDFDTVLENDSISIESVNCMMYKAMIFWLQEKYDGAIYLFRKVSLLTRSNVFNVFAAVLNRKKNQQ